MPFSKIDSLIPIELSEGVALRIMSGDKVMMSFVSLEPGGVVPDHSHPHEQMGMGVEGEFELVIDGHAQVIRRGDIYLIPSNVRHSARSLGKPAVALDIFGPPREDYLARLAEAVSKSQTQS